MREKLEAPKLEAPKLKAAKQYKENLDLFIKNKQNLAQ
jgi:hypothetical protein